jgi:hypothetical protein
MGDLRLLGEPAGCRDHAALANLAFSQAGHTGFVAAAGLAGGQSIIGGIAAGESLSLQSTTHATRGYVRAQDDLQLLSNIIRDAAANQRLALAATSPHITLSGDLRVTQHSAFAGAAIAQGQLVSVIGTLSTHPANALYASITGNRAAGPQFTYGICGGASGQGTPSASYVYGLYFYAQHASTSPCFQVGGILIQQQSAPSGTGALTAARGLLVSASYWGGSKPASVYGVDIEDQGAAGVGTAYGIRILDQTATTVRLLELGPPTPYLRLVGGAVPGANLTNLYLNEGGVLRRVQCVDPGWGGANLQAGQRVLVLV